MKATLAAAWMAVMVSAFGPALAGTNTWQGDTDGEWDNDSFDAAGATDDPTAAGDTAEFGEGATTSTVTVDSSGGAVTVGALSFSGADAYTLQKNAAGDTLTLSASGGAQVLHTDNKNHTVEADITLNNDLTATMNTEGYGVEISGDVSGTGRSLYKSGPGILTLSGVNTYDGGTWIEGGALRVSEDAASLANAPLRFNADASLGITTYSSATAVLETSGTFARNIGTGGGNVQWDARGGFAAYGGPLSVTLNGGNQLTVWDDFNRKHIFLGSPSATHPVTIENDINHNDNNTGIGVFYNPDTDQDVAILAGVMSGSFTFRPYGGGTLVVTNSANTWSGTIYMVGAVLRFGEGLAGLGGMRIYSYSGMNVIESFGTLALDLGNSAGQVEPQSTTATGFAAAGGPLALTLNDGAQITWSTRYTGFYNRNLVLGSRTANDVVTLTNPIDVNASGKDIIVPDNPHSQDDYAVISGAITTSNNQSLNKEGDGLLVLSHAGNALNDMNVNEGTLRIGGALACGDDVSINSGGTLQGGGAVTAADDVDIKTAARCRRGTGRPER